MATVVKLRGQNPDRAFFLAFILFGWLAILMGFGPLVWRRFQGLAETPASILLQIHVFAFVGWMMLLILQVALIRTGRVSWHRALGPGLLVLLPVMAISGMAAEIEAQRRRGGLPGDLSFFSSPLVETILFVALAIAAIALRRNAGAHKRLIYLATSIILIAAFNRWWGERLDALFGGGYWGPILSIYCIPNLLIAGGIAFDLATRGRVHRAYRIAVPLILMAEIGNAVVWNADWWPPVARQIIGLPPETA